MELEEPRAEYGLRGGDLDREVAGEESSSRSSPAPRPRLVGEGERGRRRGGGL